jgi:hypothetical protein
MAMVTERDREVARLLPAMFLDSYGTPGQRTFNLVSQYWGYHSPKECGKLASVLIPLLKPLIRNGSEVTDEQRKISEALVAGWIARQ